MVVEVIKPFGRRLVGQRKDVTPGEADIWMRRGLVRLVEDPLGSKPSGPKPDHSAGRGRRKPG